MLTPAEIETERKLKVFAFASLFSGGVGSIIGMLIGSLIFPGLGTLIGGLIGFFLGAYSGYKLAELKYATESTPITNPTHDETSPLIKAATNPFNSFKPSLSSYKPKQPTITTNNQPDTLNKPSTPPILTLYQRPQAHLTN